MRKNLVRQRQVVNYAEVLEPFAHIRVEPRHPLPVPEPNGRQRACDFALVDGAEVQQLEYVKHDVSGVAVGVFAVSPELAEPAVVFRLRARHV